MYFLLLRKVFGAFYHRSSPFNVHAYGVSLDNPSLCLYALYSVLHRTFFLSLAGSWSCFHRLTVINREMHRPNESTENADGASGEVTGQSVPSSGNPELVQQVFGLFKDYLSAQLDVKGKQIETKQKIDKETAELKFKGNQKQFKLNAELDNIFDQIQTANVQAASDTKISTLVSEGRKLIHKRQKLIKIADRCKDGWQVVEEYESDELASNSEDEKKLKKAKEAASRKRKARQEGKRVEDKRQKTSHAPSDHQLFRGRVVLLTFVPILC